MTRSHLRHQAGGNPARAPLPDEANEARGPQDGADFPDVPAANDPEFASNGPTVDDPDQPDLDRFAERLGISSAADADAATPDVRTSPNAALVRAEGFLSSGLGTLAQGLRSSAETIDALSTRLGTRQQH